MVHLPSHSAQLAPNPPTCTACLLSDFPNNLQCRTRKYKTLLTKSERPCEISLARSHITFGSLRPRACFQPSATGVWFERRLLPRPQVWRPARPALKPGPCSRRVPSWRVSKRGYVFAAGPQRADPGRHLQPRRARAHAGLRHSRSAELPVRTSLTSRRHLDTTVSSISHLPF